MENLLRAQRMMSDVCWLTGLAMGKTHVSISVYAHAARTFQAHLYSRPHAAHVCATDCTAVIALHTHSGLTVKPNE